MKNIITMSALLAIIFLNCHSSREEKQISPTGVENTVTMHNVDSSTHRQFYKDFNIFNLTEGDQIFDDEKKYSTYLEIEKLGDSLNIQVNYDKSLILELKLVRYGDVYSDEMSYVENDIEFLFRRHYSANRVTEFVYQRDLLNDLKAKLVTVREFLPDEKTTIWVKDIVDEVGYDFQIKNIPNDKIVYSEKEYFELGEKCLRLRKVTLAKVTGDKENRFRLCYEKLPFADRRFSYFWYVFVPQFKEGYEVKDLVDGATEQI
jgi:hypothetical protein